MSTMKLNQRCHLYTLFTYWFVNFITLYILCAVCLSAELMKMVLMSEAHRHNLNRNRVKLTKHVQSLPSIFEFLRQDYTLTAEMQEEIEVRYCSFSLLIRATLPLVA